MTSNSPSPYINESPDDRLHRMRAEDELEFGNLSPVDHSLRDNYRDDEIERLPAIADELEVLHDDALPSLIHDDLAAGRGIHSSAQQHQQGRSYASDPTGTAPTNQQGRGTHTSDPTGTTPTNQQGRSGDISDPTGLPILLGRNNQYPLHQQGRHPSVPDPTGHNPQQQGRSIPTSDPTVATYQQSRGANLTETPGVMPDLAAENAHLLRQLRAFNHAVSPNACQTTTTHIRRRICSANVSQTTGWGTSQN